MFKYECPGCGETAYSSASYSTVGVCPSCGASLAPGSVKTVPEPKPVAASEDRRFDAPVNL